MDSYIDIKIIPDEEVSIPFIRNKLYSKFHRALCDLNASNIGVSFPEYKENVNLGDVVRIHGDKQSLEGLHALGWLGGLSGYCDVSGILAVPEKVKYRLVFRVHEKMTDSKLRRLIKRGSISSTQAKLFKTRVDSSSLNNPYLEMKSSSNGQRYSRFIGFSELSSDCSDGVFDKFGLSQQASVPVF